MKSRWIVLPAVMLALLFVCPPRLLAEEPEEVWEKLNKLSGEERQKFLVSKAKEEGEVVWYTTMPADQFKPLLDGFQKRYRGIKIRTWRAGGERILNRVLTEARAGKFDFDVIAASAGHFPLLKRSGLVVRYRSPERNFYSDVHKDKEGYWTAYSYIVVVMAYNNSLVSPGESPTRYEDFLEPKWKGNFALDTDPDRTVMAWLKNWGEEKTEKFVQNLMANNPALRRGHTLGAQLLCAGEFKAAIELFAFRVVDLQQKGCPVTMVFTDPAPVTISSVFAAKYSPHPYAGGLFIDYLLSESGQNIVAQSGRFPARRGIELKHAEMDWESRKVRLLILGPDDVRRLDDKYRILREKYILTR